MFSTLPLPLCYHTSRRAPEDVSSKLKDANKTPSKVLPKEQDAKGKNDKKQNSQGALLVTKCHSEIWKVKISFILQAAGAHKVSSIQN